MNPDPLLLSAFVSHAWGGDFDEFAESVLSIFVESMLRHAIAPNVITYRLEGLVLSHAIVPNVFAFRTAPGTSA